MGGQFSRRSKTEKKNTDAKTPQTNIVENQQTSTNGEVEPWWRKRAEMEEEWRHVGAASQLIKRRCHRLYAESGRPFDLVLFTLNHRFTAMSTWCSHMGGPLHEGDIEDYKGSKCVQCPWHGYMFNVETGVNPDIGLQQDVFETKVVDNKVYVHHPRCKLSMEPFNS